MNTLSLTVLGNDAVSTLLAQRIKKQAEFELHAVLKTSEMPEAGTHCAIYMPSAEEIQSGAAVEKILALLNAGFNVVSTLPANAFSNASLITACREGKATFHGTGGFQTSLASRFNRAFASITRNIRDIELIEERDVNDIKSSSTQALESFYNAGLHILSDAVFKDARAGENPVVKGPLERQADQTQRTLKESFHPQIVVQRNLSEHVIYDSILTQRQSNIPLQYKLNTTSADAIGHVTISFHQEGDIAPVDHLTCVGLLNAVRAVCESGPGILHHDLEINYVKSDDRLAL